MKKHNLNELGGFKKELNQYLVKYPDEQEIDLTIDTLRQYVPHKQKNTMLEKDKLLTLIKRSATEITLISKTYWIVSAILFIFGYFITDSATYDPVLILVIIAPIPFMFGLVEVFKGRERGLLEMEMACKFSAYEIMLTRLFVIGIYNLTLNTILTISFVSLIDTVSMWQVILIWLTPLTFFVSISLWVSMKFRGPVFITILVSLWVIFSFLFLLKPSWLDGLIHANFVLYLLFIGTGTLLLFLQMKQLIKKYASYEGGETVEIIY